MEEEIEEKMIDNNTKFSPVAFWAKLPHPMRFHEATSVATDSNDNVYVYNRGLFPLIIFDIIVASLPTTAFFASISYQDDDNWSFLTNLVMIGGISTDNCHIVNLY